MNAQAIILGSSNSFGKTRKAIIEAIGSQPIPIYDLASLDIKPYDYEYKNVNDDYLALIEKIVECDPLILATPVYWYSMSATMKIFIDRISDLLDIRKDLGRKLKGKKLFVLATFDTSLPRGFEDPFEQTCEYLGMNYSGTSFIYSGTTNDEFLKNNIHQFQKFRSGLALSSNV